MIIEGCLDVAEGKIKLIAEKISLLNNYLKNKESTIKTKKKTNQNLIEELHLEINSYKNKPDLLIKLKEIFCTYPGKSQIIIHFKEKKKTILHIIDKEFSVNIGDKLIEKIRNILGNDKVWVEKISNNKRNYH